MLFLIYFNKKQLNESLSLSKKKTKKTNIYLTTTLDFNKVFSISLYTHAPYPK